MVGTLADSAGSTLWAWTDSLECTTLVDHDGLYDYITVIQFFCFVLIFGLPVSDSATEKSLKHL